MYGIKLNGKSIPHINVSTSNVHGEIIDTMGNIVYVCQSCHVSIYDVFHKFFGNTFPSHRSVMNYNHEGLNYVK